MNFAEAYKRLQEINTLLQSQDLVDIEHIVALQKEAKELYDTCQTILLKIKD